MGHGRAPANDSFIARKQQVCDDVINYIKQYSTIIKDQGMMHWEFTTTQLALEQFTKTPAPKKSNPEEYLVWRNIGLAIRHFQTDAEKKATPDAENPCQKEFEALISSSKFTNLDRALEHVRYIQETLYPAYLLQQLQKLLDEAPEQNSGIKALRDKLNIIVNDKKSTGPEKIQTIRQTVRNYVGVGMAFFKPSGIKGTLQNRLEKEIDAMQTALPPVAPLPQKILKNQ